MSSTFKHFERSVFSQDTCNKKKGKTENALSRF